ncbi:helix-turn-helix domain-containing protein [Pseudolysinimonas sp.]|jgi:transcriptional regulator with XRE-family HTH domain|uniref:helix-turn-helix domain-containing protein n=1 Tax=Pseudolysinimonas sp. TaxID=2680009 RepID=UPI003782D477
MPPSRTTLRDARTLGAHLTTWRKLLGYTAAQVAERAEISLPTLAKIEHGDPSVGLGALLGVTRVLGVTGLLVDAVDPYETELGRASADRKLPERVRR